MCNGLKLQRIKLYHQLEMSEKLHISVSDQCCEHLKENIEDLVFKFLCNYQASKSQHFITYLVMLRLKKDARLIFMRFSVMILRMCENCYKTSSLSQASSLGGGGETRGVEQTALNRTLSDL